MNKKYLLVLLISLVSTMHIATPSTIYAANASKTHDELEASPSTSSSDYEAVILADTLEDAERTAENYGGTLTSYEYGVGVIALSKPYTEAVSESGDMSISSIEDSAVPILPQVQFTLTTLSSSEITDGDYKKQWHHPVIHDNTMWNDGLTGDGTKVCIIDTGISTTSEVYSQVAGEKDFTGSYYGIEDSIGHGTHVAGLVAAPVDGQGTVGTAPEAELYIAKVSNGTNLEFARVIRAWEWALENNVDVVNMSFSLNGSAINNPAVVSIMNDYMTKFKDNGIVAVAAAGNEGSSGVTFPAYCENVISVGATDSDNNLATFSNYGDWVDIAVPGNGIYSTYKDGTYSYLDGTSMASPIMAGALALLHGTESVHDTNDASEYEEMMERFNTVKTSDTYTCNTHTVTGGLDLTRYNGTGTEEEKEKEETPVVLNEYPCVTVNVGDYTVTYPEKITFTDSKKAKLTNVIISGNGLTVTPKKVVVKKAAKVGQTTFKVKLDKSIDKETRKALQKVKFPVEIVAYEVSDTDNVTVKYNSKGTIKKVTVNGIKLKKNEYKTVSVTGTENYEALVFDGRFNGRVKINK